MSLSNDINNNSDNISSNMHDTTHKEKDFNRQQTQSVSEQGMIKQNSNTHHTANQSKSIDPRAWQQAATQANALLSAVSKAVIGQDTVVRQLCVCLLASGHALVEGLPGLGKTLMVKAYAKAIGGSYHRVQFTPDLMPADITGHTLYDMQTGQWKVRRGPVFCNLLLADEINRASAKTQSALLEVMQEQQVTIEGTTYDVEQPFVTIATQNPLEHEGTYPLPEAQLDRFLFNILIDYPDEQNEALMLKTVLGGQIGASLDLSQVPQVMSPERLLLLQKLTAQVSIDDRVVHYALQIIRATRQHHGIVAGSGPRGGIALLRAARANALLDARSYVIPDDVVAVATPVLRHRIALSADYQIEGVQPEQVITQILNSVPAPRQ